LGFLLIDGFSLMSWSSVLEPFRAANTLSGERLYEWRLISVGPTRRALASNGASLETDTVMAATPTLDVLFVCLSGAPEKFENAAAFAWLRKLARSGVTLVGVSGGTYALARAGVLAGYRCTIHWEHLAAFRERFADIEVAQTLYVIDRARMSCAGGIAGLDLTLDMIARDHGAKLAAMAGEWYIRTEAREAARPQRMSLRERYGATNSRLLQALALMEANIASPIPRRRIAALCGVSARQLDRLFAAHLKATPCALYVDLRLDHAQHLLKESALSITEIAAAAGFADLAHFSRRFSKRYGSPPSALRRAPKRQSTRVKSRARSSAPQDKQ
jgi:transcriptional regulator GlxA family with amidase domain